jgi:hypothetical protein
MYRIFFSFTFNLDWNQKRGVIIWIRDRDAREYLEQNSGFRSQDSECRMDYPAQYSEY